MAQVEKEKRAVGRDPLVLALIVLIVLAFVPMPFLAYRVLQGAGGGQGSVVAVLPTATATPPAPTNPPTATPPPTLTPVPTSTPTPTVLVAPLSGLDVASENMHWPPIAVMIPSDSDQYAMSQASVVYEASAEYQIQRFLAIFEQVDAEKIGPIRSARLYYIDWACPYGLVYVHWGGSPQAYERLNGIACLHELDGMSEEFPFWRGEIVDIPWNNGFTDSRSLYEAIRSRGWARTVEFRGYLHKDDAPPESRPVSGTLAINDAFKYNVYYSYDADSNSYLREYRGQPHLDLLTGQQHRVKNLVVIFVSEAPIPGDPKDRLEIQTTGEGAALFFRDGTLVQGRWVKEAPEVEMRFFDEGGQEISFNRGNIWIEVLAVGQENLVTYTLGQPPR